jgi:hypothetical protein
MTLRWRGLAERTGEVSMVFVRELLKERTKEGFLFAVSIPLAKIVQSVVQDYCEMVQTGETRRT